MADTMDEKSMLERLTQAEKSIADLARRADGHERNGSDLGKSMTDIIGSVRALGDRLSAIDRDEIEKRIQAAVDGEREKQLQSNITTILAALAKIESYNIPSLVTSVASIQATNKQLIMLVAGALITGISGLAFLLIKGGLGV